MNGYWSSVRVCLRYCDGCIHTQIGALIFKRWTTYRTSTHRIDTFFLLHLHSMQSSSSMYLVHASTTTSSSLSNLTIHAHVTCVIALQSQSPNLNTLLRRCLRNEPDSTCRWYMRQPLPLYLMQSHNTCGCYMRHYITLQSQSRTLTSTYSSSPVSP